MTIGFILNGEDVSVDADPGKRLTDILRRSFNLSRTKKGCYTGICSSCLVIINGDIVQSCLIPLFKVQGSEVITIEGFAQTDEYMDFYLGFKEAGLENCGFCNSGKILTAEALLNRNPRPAREDIIAAFEGIKCRCNSLENLIAGIMSAIEQRRRRIYGKPSGENNQKGGSQV